jgi:hypothetical protein
MRYKRKRIVQSRNWPHLLVDRADRARRKMARLNRRRLIVIKWKAGRVVERTRLEIDKPIFQDHPTSSQPCVSSLCNFSRLPEPSRICPKIGKQNQIAASDYVF